MIKSGNKNINLSLIVIFLLSSLSYSKALIEVDSADYDAGKMFEQDIKENLKHTFIISNPGTDTLKIKDVKKSCGCTLVGYDSVIAPGAKGKVIQEVKKSYLHGGTIKKGITIISNADNDSNLRLSLKLTVLPVVGANPRYIALRVSETDSGKADITLTTKKEDFKIKRVKFEPYNKEKEGWLASLGTDINFSMKKEKKKDKNGYYEYKLKISYAADVKKMERGQYIISTNHPDKEELTLRGLISPSKK